jgi:flagellar basal-body rod protein FlgB
MYGNLEIFRMAQGMATHAAARAALIAQNVANADTPGYHARDLGRFADAYRAGEADGLRRTRAGHDFDAGATWQPPVARTADRPGTAAPNGNTVSLETEMMLAAEVKGDHDRALAIYQKSLAILRTSLGRAR